MIETKPLVESLKMLYTAKWNIPQAASHCGLSIEEMKKTFYFYAQSHEIYNEQKES